MEQKAPRRTREKILELSLRLFNEFGEPNITTTIIADEMKISPGNLYYHFRNKDDIVNSIFVTFEEAMSRMLAVPQEVRPTMQDVWRYLHLMFELIWRYRFFYRDLSDLLSRNRTLELHFKEIFGHKIKVVKQLCQGLQADNALAVNAVEIDALSTNMVVTASYWLSYQYVLNPRQYTEQAVVENALASGCYQVLSLMHPYLRGQTLVHFEELTAQYLNKNGTTSADNAISSIQ
ncbi:TetR/AcrR family transcriptional regulator [Glaciimonas sp. PCH181]|uniref:TetR/AcrR family transcriptional regulator n=1 Tax=Glaciimonas sp. PCH181 TaxID=2133943 RepID=UPI000D3603C0|nr:TetR/AcrR family transcriptional regulator [Glaciimonas sp. PCH181]PUA19054.1 TetR family transcriptional regulator [Glaciimonas sp. PCH181]